MRNRTIILCLSLIVASAQAQRAHAEFRAGGLRFAIDADLLSGGVVRLDPQGPAPSSKTGVFALGPNQLGNSRVVIPFTPIGVSVDYVIKPAWLLGMRTGLGFDLVHPEGAEARKYFALSFMPELTFLPFDDRRLFTRFSPVLQYSLEKQDERKDHIFMGCFSIGGGVFLFTSPSSSVDLGAFFEGRFGDLQRDPDRGKVDVNDLRGVVRAGLSLWR